MKEELELKHLAPYLPYGLIMRDSDGIYKEDRILIFENMKWLLSNGQPILRPLSDLTRHEIDILRQMGLFKLPKEQWTKSQWRFIREVKSFPLLQKYTIVEKLLEWHFDVFGLIEKCLAIDINTLNK